MPINPVLSMQLPGFCISIYSTANSASNSRTKAFKSRSEIPKEVWSLIRDMVPNLRRYRDNPEEKYDPVQATFSI
jgi:hypothetical protein